MPETERITRQDILKRFDQAGAPLSTREVAEPLDVTQKTARDLLKQMETEGDIERKTVRGAFVWYATVAPELDEHAAAEVDRRREEDEFVPLDG